MAMQLNLSRKWRFVALSLFFATLSGIIIYFYFPSHIGLVLLFFYIIPSNSLIPFPHEPAIIYYGKLFGPLTTTLVALVPTLIACIVDYAILTPVFSRTRLSNLKNNRIYQKTVYYFYKAPFLTIFIAAISPLPFSPIRILSVASEFPLEKYAGAVLLGRAPRYYFLALFGALLNIPNWMILLFFISLVAAPVYQRIARRTHVPDRAGDDEILPEQPLEIKQEIS